MSIPTYKEIADAAGISRGYACDILSGRQAPSRALAMFLFRKLGWRHDLIADLTESQIEVLEGIEPWDPSADRSKRVAA